MLQFLTSRKLLFFAVAILLLTWIVFLTVGNQSRESSAESLLRTVVTPLEFVFDTLADSTDSVLRTVGDLNRLAAENRRLNEEIDRIAMENQILRGYQLENSRLAEALGLRARIPYRLVAAEVIARSPNNWYNRLKIDVGSADGVEQFMGVVGSGGVVGRILEVRKHTSDVLLLTDTASEIGGMVRRTGAHVLVRGENDRPGFCQLLPYCDADFRKGDQVVTWEESEYFPAGLMIGEVVTAAKGQGGMPLGGRLRPTVSPGAIDVVFVIQRDGTEGSKK